MDGLGTPDPTPLAVLIVRAAAAGDRARALALLLDGCWPGGGDRREPAALTWLRTWGPARTTVRPQACACSGGRCAICN